MERQVTITATPSKAKNISVNKATVANEITATPDTSLYYSNLSKQWATKMDSLVVGEDYSSKYYAENARISAETAKMEASTVTGLKDLLKEDFDGYTESLDNTKNLAVEEINTTSTVAIGNIDAVVTSSTKQINAVAKEQTELVASTANKALDDIDTLRTNSINTIETLSENSTEEINTLGNTIKSDATDWIDVINATGKSYNMVTHRQITNCITEIPQDIKLELNNGVLTLKAGSKVYVPNGFEADGTTPKFDEVVIESDISATYANKTPYYLFSTNNGTGTQVNEISTCNSGSTDTGSSWHVWYNTSTNKIIRYNGNGEIIADDCSLPVCIYSGETTITSIDQTFNGFGYIGSTVFVTKGVKGLIPNGRNEDGTLRNIEFVTDGVAINTSNTSEPVLVVANTTSINQPTISQYSYNQQTSYNEYLGTNAYDCIIGQRISDSSGKIISFQPKLPFRAIDYSDSSTVSGWSMPSSKYIDLTLGASQSTYTAPANGYYTLAKYANSNGQFLQVSQQSGIGHRTYAPTGGDLWITSEPIIKGKTISITYTANGNVNLFRFYYTEGEV